MTLYYMAISDRRRRIEFPVRLLFITLFSLLTTAIFFGNHSKLANSKS